MLGYDPKIYGLHILHSGGITLIVNNDTSKSISERLLKLHGNWKNDVRWKTLEDMYVQESDSSHLSISRSLGL